MKLKETKSEFSTIKEEISLSGVALAELLQATLAKGAPFRFKVKGFSMSPFIKCQDVLTVSPFNGRALGLGNIVAFIHPLTENLVIHRIVGKQGNFYLIKGDNAIKPDALVLEENILGYVTKVEREGKRVFLGLGPERFLIVLLSRTSIFFPFLLTVWRIVRSLIRRSAYG